MSVGGSGSSGSSTTEVDPDFKNAWLDLLKTAEKTADNGLTNAPDQKVAGLSSTQTQAAQLLQKQLASGRGDLTTNQGAKAALDASNYKPNQINATSVDSADLGPVAQVKGRDTLYLTGDAKTAPDFTGAKKVTFDRSAIDNVGSPTLLGADLDKYQNSFKQGVTDTTINDLERARQIALQHDNDSMIAAHAFGGSRESVAKDLTNDTWSRTLASTLADLNKTGYDTASGLAEQDLNRGLTADQSNQATDLAVANSNADRKQQTELFNTTGQAARQDSNAALKQQMELANMTAGNTARSETAAADNAARQANAAAANTANLTQAQLDQAAALANQEASMAAQGANQTAGLNKNQQAVEAAGLLSSIGGQQQAMDNNDVQSLLNVGGIQQSNTQAGLNANYQNQLADYQAKLLPLQTIESAFGIMPSTAQGSNSTSSSKSAAAGFGG